MVVFVSQQVSSPSYRGLAETSHRSGSCKRALRGNDMNSPLALLISSLVAFSSFGSAMVLAQDMMGLDVTSDAFTKSEMTRADIERVPWRLWHPAQSWT